jgi:hypothetical protein
MAQDPQGPSFLATGLLQRFDSADIYKAISLFYDHGNAVLYTTVIGNHFIPSSFPHNPARSSLSLSYSTSIMDLRRYLSEPMRQAKSARKSDKSLDFVDVVGC